MRGLNPKALEKAHSAPWPHKCTLTEPGNVVDIEKKGKSDAKGGGSVRPPADIAFMEDARTKHTV